MCKIVKMVDKTYFLLSLDEVFFFKVSFLSLLVFYQVSDVTLDHSFDLTISKSFGSFVQKWLLNRISKTGKWFMDLAAFFSLDSIDALLLNSKK